jgi:hypothetical protein
MQLALALALGMVPVLPTAVHPAPAVNRMQHLASGSQLANSWQLSAAPSRERRDQSATQ